MKNQVFRYIKKLVKVGNSYGITLPKWWLELVKLKNGDDVVIEFEGEKAVITKLKKRK